MTMIIPRPPRIKDFETVSSSDVEFSSCDTLLLPWSGTGSSSLVPSNDINTPAVIETSRWTKSVLLKACKAFGINAAGFEHEILGMVLRMEQRRQEQILKQELAIKANKKGKKKQTLELERLKWGMNSDGKKSGDRDRTCKAFSG